MMQPSDQIKEKLDLVDFLKGYLEVKQAGRNFKALCPFHQEKTPSFMISPDRQIWHCFGCSLGGDIFKFIMEYENIEFYEALKILAEKAGIELRSLGSGDYKQFGILYEINNEAKDFYINALKENASVKKYLVDRGFNNETVNEFEIGYAPNNFDSLVSYLMKKGHKIDDVMRAGVIFKTDKGKYGDRFRGRIMFPIHNHFGKVVGFSGRILPELENNNNDTSGTSGFVSAKYINSPETPIFNKSKVMYGFFRSKQAIRESKTALLVEGQVDFLLAWQNGVRNVVATSGTALTSEHVNTLSKIADKIVLAYDNDDAGHMAADRVIDLLGANDFVPMVLDLKDYKDPADAVMDDKDFLREAIEKAKPAIEYYFDKYLSKNVDRKKGIRMVLQKIANLYSNIDRSIWLRELSYKTGISESDLRDEANKIKKDSESVIQKSEEREQNKKSDTPSRLERLSMQVMALALENDKFKDMTTECAEFMPERMREAYGRMFGIREGGEYSEEELRRLIDYISLKYGDLYDQFDEDTKEKELKNIIYELELESLKLKTETLKNQIRVAELKGDEDTLKKRLEEFDSISTKMQDIKNNKGQNSK